MWREVSMISLLYNDANHTGTPLEAQTREAFCNTLTTDVVNPLVTLKVRMRTIIFSRLGF
jgi:hypothetical protein